MINSLQLAACCDCPLPRAENWVAPMNLALTTFAIDTAVRQAAFLAQVAHESGGLKFVREIWGPTPAQRGYEGRRDLGNIQAGDGFRFIGRGLLQTTGRANYAMTRDRLRDLAEAVPDFEVNPALLEAPKWAALSAGLFWHARGLNALADAGDFLGVSVKINGRNRATGLPNGWDDRRRLWSLAQTALGA